MGVINNKYFEFVISSLDDLLNKCSSEQKDKISNLKRTLFNCSLTKKQCKEMAGVLRKTGFANPIVTEIVVERLENIMFNRKSKVAKQQSKNDARLQELMEQNSIITYQIESKRNDIKTDMAKKDFISYRVHKAEIIALENRQAALKIQIDQLVQVNLGLSSSKDASDLRKANKDILRRKNNFNENEIVSSYESSRTIVTDIEKKNDFIAENIPNALDDPEFLEFQRECEDFESECKTENSTIGDVKDEMF